MCDTAPKEKLPVEREKPAPKQPPAPAPFDYAAYAELERRYGL